MGSRVDKEWLFLYSKVNYEFDFMPYIQSDSDYVYTIEIFWNNKNYDYKSYLAWKL